MKKLIIFDLDGTLLDTVDDIFVTLNTTLEKFNLKPINRNEIVSKLGYGAKKLVELSVGDIESSEFEKVYADYCVRLANCENSLTKLYDGLDVCLKALKSDGYKLAVVSNKPEEAVQVVCKDKLNSYGFDFVMGNRPGEFNPKPDKSCVEYCLNKMGINKEDAIYVGDSEVDVQTFLNVEIDGVAVLWGFRSRDILEKAGAIRFAPTGAELYDIIKSLN